jgi:saccharopine dehydrogenase-like NADP-dependent oxidoreductase
MHRVLVLGGYGAFGARVTERLARHGGIEIVIAGRSMQSAQALAARISQASASSVVPSCLDAGTITAGELAAIGATVVINASGPFQWQDYSLPRACITARTHYVDLADARRYVADISALDADARAAGVLVISGASTVPALSSAVVDACAPQFQNVRGVTTLISPGNGFDPGLATTRSILSSLGRPIPARQAGATGHVLGWQGLHRRNIPGLGSRWAGHCDAPDLDVFPERYRGLERVEVLAGLEVSAFHLALWAMSGAARLGLIRSPQNLAKPLLAVKRRLGFLGSDRGGMLVVVDGIDASGKARHIEWALVARQGHGPYIPATPAVIVTRHLLDGVIQLRGATPCVGFFTLDDFRAEVADLDITMGST